MLHCVVLYQYHTNHRPVEGVIIIDHTVGDDLVQNLRANLDSLSVNEIPQEKVKYILNPDIYSYRRERERFP